MKDAKSSDDLAGTEEYWGPFNQVMVDSALEAAKTNDNVVITFAHGFQIGRDFVINKLKEGGATNVTLLCLVMDQNKKLEGLYHRSKRQAEAIGVSFGEWMRSQGWESDADEPSMEEFKKFMGQSGRLGAVRFEDPPSYAKVVDVTGRDVTAIDGVDAALGLCRSDEESYDDIVKKVVAMDHKRDEETPYSIEAFPEIEKEVKAALAEAKTEEEKKQIKKRASCLIKMESATRGLGVATISDSNKDKMKRRRSTLIRMGSIAKIDV